ncbi:MAG TPA: energy-coupling factor transporter transmembrane component T [Nitrososphaerales archaeon]|nr:energy-coupling factor transporter transmembrane component T [Nitrososphaerales archaeon]
MYWLRGGFVFTRVVSPFHRLDPRIKLLVSLEFFLTSLITKTVPEVLAVLLAILGVAALAKSLKRIARTMAFSGLFALFIFAVNFLFGIGLLNAVVYSVRFLAIISSTSIFFVTTSPDELEQIMTWMHVPRDVVFAFVTAVRFIPVVMLDALQIMDAQKSRGLEFERGNVVKRVRNMVPIMIPLVVNSVIRSGELAEAMESRAYGSTPKPTSLYKMNLRWYDAAVAAAGLAVLAAVALYIYHYVHFGA